MIKADVADLKVVVELGATTPVPQVAALPRTHTCTVIKMTPGIPDPAEIAEVDGYKQDPETPQHDGVQRWCSLDSYAALREATSEGEEREEEAGAPGGEEAHGSCVFSSPVEPSFI
jgi:hypothetical protein